MGRKRVETVAARGRRSGRGFWQRWWWLYPVLFGGGAAYQLITGDDPGRNGPAVIGVPACIVAAIVGGYMARTGRLDRRS